MKLDLPHIFAHLDQIDPDDHTWRHDAECRGMDVNLFMPARGEVVAASNAMQVCETCPVKWNCLLAGFDEKIGIWGGFSERQRRQLRPRWDRHSGTTARQRTVS